MPTSTLKLQTNIPLTGFVRYANYWKGKPWTDPETKAQKMLPDQIQLKGSWDGSTDEGLFLPIALVGQMLDMGLIRQEQQPDDRGNPKYTVLNGTRKVRVLKTEDGKKKPVHISWADAPATTAAPAPATTKAPPPPERKKSPEQLAAPTAPANGDAVKLDQLRKAHRKALKTIGDTNANAWRGAKYQIDLLLAEWGIERSKVPTHVYLDLIARFGASSGIEAFRQNLVVEHKARAAAESPRPGVAAQAAVPLKPIDAEPPALAPLAKHEDEHGQGDGDAVEPVPGPVENADFWPEEEDDLPF